MPILRGHSGEECKEIEEYIRRQLEEDKAGEQLTIGNFQETHLWIASNKLINEVIPLFWVSMILGIVTDPNYGWRK